MKRGFNFNDDVKYYEPSCYAKYTLYFSHEAKLANLPQTNYNICTCVHMRDLTVEMPTGSVLKHECFIYDLPRQMIYHSPGKIMNTRQNAAGY